MEILVCMKQVPDDSVEIRLGKDGQPDLSQAESQGNAFDTYALEMAVRYIEANGGSVTVLTVGTEDDKTCLRNSLSVGAAKVALIEGSGTDAAGTAALLAGGIRKLEAENGAAFDLVFCGRESTDYIGGEVGEILAENLKRPFVTDVVEVEPADAKVVVKKELESGYLKVESPLPSVFTIAKPNYDPRYPSVKSKIAARRAKIPTVAQSELALEDGALAAKVSHKAFLEPPKREAGVLVKEADAATAVAKAFEILAADKVL